MKIQVSELIVRYLERLGVEVIFGMPGAHILPVYDSLYDSSIKNVLAKHEQGAAFMAGGFTRVSGKISACIATAGPGATNLVTGIANAYADKQPIVVITGEAPTHIFGKGGLQESSGEGGSIDQTALFKGITRYNKVIERTDYLGQVLNQATKVLQSSDPGPVLLSFPYNVQKELVDADILDRLNLDHGRHGKNRNAQAMCDFIDLLQAAERPVIVAGFGCIQAGAQAEVEQFSQALNIPVTTSLKGKGVISEGSPLSLGSLGVTSGGYAYHYIIEQADLLIFLGASFNERTSYLWNDRLLQGKKIVQVDKDYKQLEKVFVADVAIEGDIREVMAGCVEAIRQSGVPRKSFATSRWDVDADGALLADTAGDALLSSFTLVKTFFKKLEQRLQGEAQVFDDNIIFAQNYFNASAEKRYYPNSGVSSLGHAIPAAIGARFCDERATFAILGDGGFQMCCMEIMTAVNYAIPLNIVVFNNATMGLIRKNQFQQYEGRYIGCDFINPDFAYLAKSFGIEYKLVASEQDIDDLFDQCDMHSKINLIEIPIDKNAFPNYSSRR